MCMTLQSLVLFLNAIGPEVVTTEPGRITVHATAGDVLWIETGEAWCIDGIPVERRIRLGH